MEPFGYCLKENLPKTDNLDLDNPLSAHAMNNLVWLLISLLFHK